MFFRSRSHEPAGDNPRVADPGAGADETTARQTQPLIEWRRSAQRVTRAWNAWIASEPRDRGVRYHSFMAALAGEESAAVELERIINPAKTGQCVQTIDAQKSGLGAP